MNMANNDIVNDSFLKENNIVNDNVRKKSKVDPGRKADVENIAKNLCDKLNNPCSYNYYMKIAWRLPPFVIYNNLEKAMKGRSPARLFTWLCNQSLNN